jgi:choline dehydrogenase-like flavoprotein
MDPSHVARCLIQRGAQQDTCGRIAASIPTAVVDSAGRVHGTRNGFVADASIMPHIPRANTNLTYFLIGWRVADLLLAPR